MSEDEWITLFACHRKNIDDIQWVKAEDYEKVSERLRIALAQIALLKRALTTMSEQVSHLQARIEKFGPKAELSVHLASAAAEFGVTHGEDISFDLDSITAVQAGYVNARVSG